MRQRATAASQAGPCGACRRPWRYDERRVVRRDEAGPRAALDAHVADRHPLLHREGSDGAAAILEDVARSAADPDPGDEREDDVLGADARPQAAVDADLVRLRIALEECLGGEHHLHFARPDPERERPEGAMGGRVAVAAHDRHARLGQAQLRPDHVDDPLRVRSQGVERDAELGAVVGELRDLGCGHLVHDREPAWRGGRGVVRGRHRAIRPAHMKAPLAQAGERLGAGDLVDEVEINREDGG